MVYARLAGIVLPIIVLVAACSGGHQQDPQFDAINAVALSREFGNPASTPPPEGDFDCVIHGGGPAPGITLDGICRWDAERDSDGWIVSITQTWLCADFGADVEGYERCDGETASHTWRHRVDAQGRITYLDDFGHFPPTYAE